MLEQKHIDKIVETYEKRVDVDKFAHVAKMSEIAENGYNLNIPRYVDTFEEVDMAYNNAIKNGATSVLEPELEPWGQRTCYIADPEGNLIEIGSWNKVYEQKDL